MEKTVEKASNKLNFQIKWSIRLFHKLYDKLLIFVFLSYLTFEGINIGEVLYVSFNYHILA